MFILCTIIPTISITVNAKKLYFTYAFLFFLVTMGNYGNQLTVVLFVAIILSIINHQSILKIQHIFHQFFLKHIKKKTQNNKQCEARYKRALKRQDKTNKLYQDELFEDLNELSENVLHNTNLTSDVSTQVAFDITDSSIFNFECSFDNNNAMTQISGPSLVKVCNIHKIDQSCGPDYPLFDRYFHGFISIKNQQ